MFSFDWGDSPQLPCGPSDATVSEMERRGRCHRERKGGGYRNRCDRSLQLFFFFSFFFSWAPVVWKGRLCGSKIFQRREYTVCAQLDMFIEEILPCLEKGHFYFCMFYCEKLPTAQSHLKSPEEQLSAVVFHLWGWLMFKFKMTACTAYKMCRNFTWPYQNPN